MAIIKFCPNFSTFLEREEGKERERWRDDVEGFEFGRDDAHLRNRRTCRPGGSCDAERDCESVCPASRSRTVHRCLSPCNAPRNPLAPPFDTARSPPCTVDLWAPPRPNTDLSTAPDAPRAFRPRSCIPPVKKSKKKKKKKKKRKINVIGLATRFSNFDFILCQRFRDKERERDNLLEKVVPTLM